MIRCRPRPAAPIAMSTPYAEHHSTARRREPHPPMGIAHPPQPRMYTGVPGVGTSVWKNAAMSTGIRTQPWEAGRRGKRDMIASVEDENLILQVDLDPQATAMGDQYLGRPRAG
jgi:hypothetical protein